MNTKYFTDWWSKTNAIETEIRTKMLILVMVSSLFLVEAVLACNPGKCGPGQYLNLTNTQCEPCGVDKWLNKTNHGCHTCFNCDTLDDNPNKIIVVQCSPTSNTIFGCRENYTMSGDKCKAVRKTIHISTVLPTEPSVSKDNERLSPTTQADNKMSNQDHTNYAAFVATAVVVGLVFVGVAMFLVKREEYKRNIKCINRRQDNENNSTYDQNEADTLKEFPV